MIDADLRGRDINVAKDGDVESVQGLLPGTQAFAQPGLKSADCERLVRHVGRHSPEGLVPVPIDSIPRAITCVRSALYSSPS
jgi:hypothetical protein